MCENYEPYWLNLFQKNRIKIHNECELIWAMVVSTFLYRFKNSRIPNRCNIEIRHLDQSDRLWCSLSRIRVYARAGIFVNENDAILKQRSVIINWLHLIKPRVSFTVHWLKHWSLVTRFSFEQTNKKKTKNSTNANKFFHFIYLFCTTSARFLFETYS